MTLDQLETYFKSNNDIPKEIDRGFYKIMDSKKFIGSHISTLRNNPGNKVYFPYYNRLLDLYMFLENKK